MEKAIMNEIEKAVPHIMKISKQMWIDYDKEADVLYISFEKPQHADDSVMEGDKILHLRDKKVVGLTILHASNLH